MRLIPGLSFLVLGLDPKSDWATFSNKQWQEWLQDNWKEQQ